MKKTSQIAVSIREIASKLFENKLNLMAKELNIHYAQLTNYGKSRNPGADVLQRFAEYGINVNYVLTGKGSIFADNKAGKELREKYKHDNRIILPEKYKQNIKEIKKMLDDMENLDY